MGSEAAVRMREAMTGVGDLTAKERQAVARRVLKAAARVREAAAAASNESDEGKRG